MWSELKKHVMQAKVARLKDLRVAALERICQHRDTMRKAAFQRMICERWVYLTCRHRMLRRRVQYVLSKQASAWMYRCMLAWHAAARFHLRGRARMLWKQYNLLRKCVQAWGDHRAARRSRSKRLARETQYRCCRLQTARLHAWMVVARRKRRSRLLAARFLCRQERRARQVCVEAWELWATERGDCQRRTSCHHRRLQHLDVRRVRNTAADAVCKWAVFAEERRGLRRRLSVMEGCVVGRLRLKRLELCFGEVYR